MEQPLEQLTEQEQVEDAVYAQFNRLEQFIRSNDSRIVSSLILQYIQGQQDVGIMEALTLEQAKGIGLFIEDMLLAAEHLDLPQD